MIACPSLPRLGTGDRKHHYTRENRKLGTTRGPWGELLARRLLIRVTDLSGENVPGLSGGFIRMATNGVDDCQKAMPHRGGQRRPNVDHTLKIRWNACGHVCVSGNPRLR